MEDSLLLRNRPEIAAGGFSRDDGTIEFYLRVRSLMGKSDVVLDLGAGRGAQLVGNSPSLFVQNMKRIKGNVAKYIGADVDPVVLENKFLDEAVVFNPNENLPFPDNYFDVVISDLMNPLISRTTHFCR